MMTVDAAGHKVINLNKNLINFLKTLDPMSDCDNLKIKTESISIWQ